MRAEGAEAEEEDSTENAGPAVIDEADFDETYEREMSPMMVVTEKGRLNYDDKQLDVIDQFEDLAKLVSTLP